VVETQTTCALPSWGRLNGKLSGMATLPASISSMFIFNQKYQKIVDWTGGVKFFLES
jgi:hypothetical protein